MTKHPEEKKDSKTKRIIRENCFGLKIAEPAPSLLFEIATVVPPAFLREQEGGIPSQ